MSAVFRHPQSTPARNYQNDVGMRAPKPPDRPALPYMRYSRKMWPKVRAENPDVQLWDIGKLVGKMWHETTDAEKSIFQHEYELEKSEYEKQLKIFQSSGFSNFMSSKGRAKNNEKMSRSRMDAGGVVIQPVDEDEGAHEMTTRKLAGIRFERNNRMVSDLFSPNIVTDTRTIVAQQRMDMLKRQAASLAQHQSKLEEELVKLQNVHNTRKRSIEKGSEDFEEELKKVVEEKPVVDEAKFEENVAKWEGKLKEAYAVYKKKQDETAAVAAASTASSAPLLRNLVMDEVKVNGVERTVDFEYKETLKWNGKVEQTTISAQEVTMQSTQNNTEESSDSMQNSEAPSEENRTDSAQEMSEPAAEESTQSVPDVPVVEEKPEESTAVEVQPGAAVEGVPETVAHEKTENNTEEPAKEEKTEEKMEGVEEAQ